MMEEDYFSQLVRADEELVSLRSVNREMKEVVEYQKAKISNFDTKMKAVYDECADVRNENKLSKQQIMELNTHIKKQEGAIDKLKKQIEDL